MIAVILSLGSPAYIVKRVLDYRERKAKMQLQLTAGGASADEVKKLEDENKLLRERVENLESIVVGVDFELNQKIAKLVGTASMALPPAPAPAAPAPAADKNPSPPPSPAPSPPPVSSGLERTMTQHASPTPREPGELKAGESLANRYTIQRLLGKGGMGAVYLASDEVLGEPVALKVISSSSAPWDPTLVERFRREAAAARKISSPNVIRLHDIGEARPGLLYL